MTGKEYKEQRMLRGTQKEVAQRLGISIRTIQRREASGVEIPREAESALRAVPVR